MPTGAGGTTSAGGTNVGRGGTTGLTGVCAVGIAATGSDCFPNIRVKSPAGGGAGAAVGGVTGGGSGDTISPLDAGFRVSIVEISCADGIGGTEVPSPMGSSVVAKCTSKALTGSVGR